MYLLHAYSNYYIYDDFFKYIFIIILDNSHIEVRVGLPIFFIPVHHKKIVAALRGMHVAPAKHSYTSVTDGQTDGRTTDKVIPMCRYASQATQKFG